MKKYVYFFIIFLSIYFFSTYDVVALKCNYNFSGYKEDDTIWTVDSSKSKPAEMVKSIGTMRGAGTEPVINWTSAVGGYKAKTDIDSGKCPEYLIQTYTGTMSQGYKVYLADSSHKSTVLKADEVQKYGIFSWDRSVIAFKLANKNLERQL